jgi:hypothetical protein
VQSGRLVDGMLLDIYEVEAKDGRTLTMLLFNYRIAGVDYECSQDITAMRDVVNASRGAGWISLHRALSARQSVQQHRCRGGLDNNAGPAHLAGGHAGVRRGHLRRRTARSLAGAAL